VEVHGVRKSGRKFSKCRECLRQYRPNR
jgi:hypothetical protein